MSNLQKIKYLLLLLLSLLLIITAH